MVSFRRLIGRVDQIFNRRMIAQKVLAIEKKVFAAR